MIDPATAKIIGWIGRVFAVVLFVGGFLWLSKSMDEEVEKEKNDGKD